MDTKRKCGHKNATNQSKMWTQNENVDTKMAHKNVDTKLEVVLKMWTQNENVDTKMSGRCIICGHKMKMWTQKSPKTAEKWAKIAVFGLNLSEVRNLYFY